MIAVARAAAASQGWDAASLTSIVVAVIALVGGAITGWLTLRGKREEASAAELRELLTAQGAFNDRMEKRVERLERSNDDLHRKLRAEEDQSQTLRLALRRAVESIRALIEWANGPRTGPPPTPTLDDLEAVLVRAETPTARLPPVD